MAGVTYEPEPTEAPAPWGRKAVALAAAALVAAVVGFDAGASLHRHGTRPSLAASEVPAPSLSAPAPGSVPLEPGGATSSLAGIVDINTVLGYGGGRAAGTGMIISSSGEILTNNHVIDGSTSISVTSVTTGRTYQATVVGTDPTQDVAVLQLRGVSGLATIPLASSAVSVGDRVSAVGNAGGAGGSPAVVDGAVQALNQTITATDDNGANAETLTGLIEINAALQPGDSGGPLVNQRGQVVGMDTAASAGRRFSAGGTVGFAIPIARALDVARQIESGVATGTIHIGLPGFLGVRVAPGATGGAGIAGVISGSPASKAGLAAGDTITSIDGQPVDSPQTMSMLTRSHHPGDRVAVGWTDQSGVAHTATVVLVTGPAD